MNKAKKTPEVEEFAPDIIAEDVEMDEEEIRMLEENDEYANQKTPETIEEVSAFMEHNKKLIHAILKPYRGLDEYDDLFQEASLGFFKGIQTYDPNREIKLTTYAYTCGKNQVKMYLRRSAAKSRTATVVSLEAGFDGDDDRDNMLNRDLEQLDPLNEPVSLEDRIHTSTLFHTAMDIVMHEMSKPQQIVITEMMKGTPQSQTAKILKTSQSEVSKILKTAICDLRLKMQERGIVDTD